MMNKAMVPIRSDAGSLLVVLLWRCRRGGVCGYWWNLFDLLSRGEKRGHTTQGSEEDRVCFWAAVVSHNSAVASLQLAVSCLP